MAIAKRFFFGLLCLTLSCQKVKKGKDFYQIDHSEQNEVVFAYPLPNLDQVVTSTKIFAKVTPKDAAHSPDDYAIGLRSSEGRIILGESKVTEILGDSFLFEFQPKNLLKEGQDYRALLHGPKGVFSEWHFSTEKGAYSDGFFLVKAHPIDGPFQVLTEHSTIRLTFSRPLLEASLYKGVYLLDERGVRVPIKLYSQDRRLSIDPIEDLEAGKDYQLVLTGDLKSKEQESLAETSLLLGIAPVGKPLMMAIDISPSAAKSFLSGRPSGIAQMSSILTQDMALGASGTLQGELASMGRHPYVTPFTVRKGAGLRAPSFEVFLGGKIKSGLETGSVDLRFLSDATGFIFPRLIGKKDGALSVLMYADLAIETQNPVIQKTLGSEILHVAMMGMVRIKGRKMILDIESDFTIPLLGDEKAYVHFASQSSAPAEPSFAAAFTPAPFTVKADPYVEKGQNGHISLTFNHPLDYQTLSSIRVDGRESSVSFRKDKNFITLTDLGYEPGKTYELDLSKLASHAGESLETEILFIDTRVSKESFSDEPLVLAMDPGTPCVLFGGDWRDGGDLKGSCRPHHDSKALPKAPLDTHDPSMPLRVIFSHYMDPSSFQKARHCGDERASLALYRYKEVDGKRVCAKAVDFTFSFLGKKLEILPKKPLSPNSIYALYLGGMSSPEDSSRCVLGAVCSEDQRSLRPNPASSYAKDYGKEGILAPFRVEKKPGVVGVDAKTSHLENSLQVILDPKRAKPFSGILTQVELLTDKPLELEGAILLDMMPIEGQKVPLKVGSAMMVSEGISIKAQSLSNEAKALNLVVSTGPLLTRVVEGSSFEVRNDDDGRLVVAGKAALVMEAPRLDIRSAGIALSSDIHGKRLDVMLTGSLHFNEDGMMISKLTNNEPIPIEVGIWLGSRLASIYLQVPRGGLRLETASRL